MDALFVVLASYDAQSSGQKLNLYRYKPWLEGVLQQFQLTGEIKVRSNGYQLVEEAWSLQNTKQSNPQLVSKDPTEKEED